MCVCNIRNGTGSYLMCEDICSLIPSFLFISLTTRRCFDPDNGAAITVSHFVWIKLDIFHQYYPYHRLWVSDYMTDRAGKSFAIVSSSVCKSITGISFISLWQQLKAPLLCVERRMPEWFKRYTADNDTRNKMISLQTVTWQWAGHIKMPRI